MRCKEVNCKVMIEASNWLQDESNLAIKAYLDEPTLKNFNRLVELAGKAGSLSRELKAVLNGGS